MHKILAVSGGVDSMALLHMYRAVPDVVVAHFDHGTRPSSRDDRLFVQQIARQYDLLFETAIATLGSHASEASARTARYDFLRRVARKYSPAVIYTAHHLDDLLESIAINLIRGTGWRGLAPFDTTGIQRPFLQTASQCTSSEDEGFPISRADILKYASKHRLRYRQDPTNSEDLYLRNRLRQRIVELDGDTKQALYALFVQQKSLKSQISSIISELLPRDGVYQRAWFARGDDAKEGTTPTSPIQDKATSILPISGKIAPISPVLEELALTSPAEEDLVYLEILRSALNVKGITATRPQIQDFLHAIRTYTPEKSFNLPNSHLIKIHKNYFSI